MPHRTRTWLTAVTLLATTALAGESGYHSDRSILVGGDGGWDYICVDTSSHRVFVTHATHVAVVDTRTDSLVGDIPDTPASGLPPSARVPTTFCVRASIAVVFRPPPLNVNTRPEALS